MEKVHDRFVFLCARTVDLSFVLLTLNCARLGFIFHFVLLALNCACLGALQYWLGYTCKCEASAWKSTWNCFLHKDETTTQLPYDMQQSMPYSYIQSRKWPISDQYSRWRHGTTFSHHALYVLICMLKRLSSLNFDFSRNIKAVLRQKLSWEIHWTANLIGMA